MTKLKTALRYLFGKPTKRTALTFTSNLKTSDLPKGEWCFVSCSIVIDEVAGYWLEDCRILHEDKRRKKTRKMFCGDLADLTTTK